MARAAGGGCRKEAAGWEGDEGQCDSGIESLRSLPGGRDAPAGVEPPVPAEEPPAEERPAEEPPVEERLDSSYGSGALPEALPRLPAACRAEEPPPPAEGLSRRQLEALTFVSEDGDTLVHLAIIHCVPDVALCCIAQLPREVLEIQNDLFQTPLHLAVYLEQPSVVEALMHKGVNPGLQDRNGNTPLHLACEQQRLYCAQKLLQGTALPQGTAEPPEHHQDLQLQNWQGLACLHISTLKGNIQMMSLLLQSGANIDVQEGTSGKTPLHLAVECRNRRAVQFLLHNGAYVDAQMYNGCTPLHLAVGRKDAAIAAILSHSGADTLLRNMENETAQDLADGNDDLLALLPFDDLKISGKPVVCSE
ncbi:NF-kappa-B inhibitor epsilon [Cygnus atratus]|uniref:NF-kappa-B inhibitor epsilon n=1 Tax=Cygnus atratus TaxID=8868 RepID=UPI0015D64B9F|nr:NF-kappa-B inhibitor epsilon [Cygnus atratus]